MSLFSSAYFPRRLFWKFFFTLIVLMNILFITAMGLGSYIIDFNFYAYEPLVLLGIFLGLSAITAFAFSYRFSSPMKRVILKALRIANKRQVSEEEDVEEYLEEEPGEYVELEIALDKIRRKMKKRRIQLAQEREESQALMSSLDDAILSVNKSLRVQFFNSKFANLFMERRQTEALGRAEAVSLAEVFREPELFQLFHRVIETGETSSLSLKMISVIDQRTKYYSVKVSPLRAENDGLIYGAMAVFHDVTELKMAELIRIEFVENASHELRTPLTSIKGFVDTAKEDLRDGKTEQLEYFFKIISKNVDRLAELVNDMLTLSSLESGFTLKKETVNPDELTQDLLERMSPLAMEKKIMVKIFSEASPFQADPKMVDQILQNLVGNAIKYIPVGGMVEIKWTEENGWIHLQVGDNGPGIAEQHLPRLFERFYRIDKGRSRDVGGTGLGLSIVKHIMQVHGGSVQVRSQAGQGATFLCSFPR